ncbi:MAG: putative lyase [Clostridiaceae bacterium]|nr:putative lyase [Clostridiaceae bacterium]
MKLNKVHHIAIICSDYTKSKDFYTNILGLKVIKETYRRERQSYKLDMAVGDNYQIELFSFPNAPKRLTYPEACGLRHLAFEVDNIESIVKELSSKKIKVEPTRLDEITGRKFVFFNDPDNLPIELYEK